MTARKKMTHEREHETWWTIGGNHRELEDIQISSELCQEILRRSDAPHQGKMEIVSGAELVE